MVNVATLSYPSFFYAVVAGFVFHYLETHTFHHVHVQKGDIESTETQNRRVLHGGEGFYYPFQRGKTWLKMNQTGVSGTGDHVPGSGCGSSQDTNYPYHVGNDLVGLFHD